MSPEFIAVDVEPTDAWPDGVSRRFKVAHPSRPVARVFYESEEGLAGWWRVAAAGPDGRPVPGASATATLVEDSSDGTVRLVSAGEHGLALEHEATKTRAREPYLLLAADTAIE